MHIRDILNLSSALNHYFRCRFPNILHNVNYRAVSAGRQQYPSLLRKNPVIPQFLLNAVLLVMLYGITYSVSALTNAEINDMVAAHNAVRQRVAQAESLRLGGRVSIPNLAWEPAIAAVAQEWADTLIKNNPPIIVHREDLQQRGLGENIYEGWATNVPIDQSAGKAMEFWASEEPWYNYTKNTCEAPPDRSCGHYTQVVWSSTRWLGCGRATRKIDNKEYVIWVCNYKPPGNISGQRPYSVRPEGVINGGQKQNLIPLFHLLLK